MIRLRKLRLQNFRSFYGDSVIEFPANGLLLIRGGSKDHGDSSGSGKSSIMLAIAYALGICPLPATVLKSWGAEEDMEVELTLDTDEGTVILRRGSRGHSYENDRATASGKNVMPHIEELTGLKADVLAAITYRIQNTRGVFLSMTDVEKKEFLTGLLNLGVIEAALERSETELAAMKPILAEQEHAADSTVTQIGMLKALELPPEPPALAFTDQEYRDLETEEMGLAAIVETPRAKWTPSADLKRLEQATEVLKTKLVSLRNADKDRRLSIEALQRSAYGLKECLARVDQQLADNEKRLAAIKPGLCPTCLQGWNNTEVYRSSLVKAVAQIQEEREGIITSIQELPPLSMPSDTKLLYHLKTRFETNPEIAQWEAKAAEVAAQYAGLAAKEQLLYQNLGKSSADRLREVRKHLEGCRQARRSHDFAMRRREDWVRNHNGEIAGLEGKLFAIQESIGRWVQKINAEQDWQALMGRKGFLGVIFDDVLAEIREEVNTQLARLANVSSVTLDFVSETLTKTGTAKKAIQPVFYVNGNETRFESLSGGQQTSVELVVDLALMVVVQRRTSTLPGFLLLDEAFNGQGTVTKEAALEVLRQYAGDKLIVVVDHTSETKEFFSQVIEVVNEGGRSSIA